MTHAKKSVFFLLIIVLVLSIPGLVGATPPTNSAPVLDASKTPALSSIYQDSPGPTGAVGTLVSSLVDFATPAGGLDNVTDVDSGALLGIAVIAVDSIDVTCSYSLNNGATWTAFGSVSTESARLLAANSTNRIYCVAAPDTTGNFSAITFRAWDQTTGSDGSTADASSGGGTRAFSSVTDIANLLVTRHPLLATNLSAAETYRKNTALNLTNIVVTDPDSATVSVTLTISNTAAGSLNTDTSGAVTSAYDSETGVWTANGAIADVNTLLAGLTFTPATDFTSDFTISTSLDDGVDSLSGSKAFTRTSAPIAITNCTDLQNIQDHLDESYQITADTIDCVDVDFQPIGTVETPFTGTLDGNNKTILNLTISTTTNVVGLFSEIQGATIQDLTFSGGGVAGHQHTGLLAGNAVAPNTITGITSFVPVTGTDYVGGIFGGTGAGTGTTTLSDVHTNTTINGAGFVGGLVGDSEGPTLITRSSVGGAVSNTQYVAGGLVGYAVSTTIEFSFATSTVTTPSSKCCTGGIVGELDVGSFVTDSYSTGAIHGGSGTGGVVGEDDAGIFTNVYATGNVATPVGDHGGLSAYGGGTFIHSFWDTETTSQATSFGGTGASTTAMKSQDTYTGWDFGSVWGIDAGINNGYPFLLWQTFAPSKVTGLSATAEGLNRIALSWTAPDTHHSAITGYKIERKLQADEEWSVLVADTESTATTYNDDTILSDVEYNYRVSAISAVGTGAASNSASVTAQTPTPTPTPHSSGGGGSSGYVSASFNRPSPQPTPPDLNKTPASPTPVPAPISQQHFTFSGDLGFGRSGDDVKTLQQFLNGHGFPVALSGLGSAGNETNSFGGLTRKALAKFQKANGITPALGYFGPKTRAFILGMK